MIDFVSLTKIETDPRFFLFLITKLVLWSQMFLNTGVLTICFNPKRCWKKKLTLSVLLGRSMRLTGKTDKQTPLCIGKNSATFSACLELALVFTF